MSEPHAGVKAAIKVLHQCAERFTPGLQFAPIEIMQDRARSEGVTYVGVKAKGKDGKTETWGVGWTSE